jgi:hypothetical protein
VTIGETDTTIEDGRDVPRRPEGGVARLARHLAARRVHDQALGCTVRAADLTEIELLAARHGYVLHVSAVEEPGSLWVVFRPR